MFSNNKLATAVIGVLVVLAYPYETTVVPEQRALFVTNDMHPIKDALIRQSWQHYSLESEGHEEDLPTDSHGRVTFPKRTIRAPLIWRALGPLADIAGQGVHASFGVHTDMFPVPNTGGIVISAEIAQPQPGDHVFR
jgi:hypothetical protein